VCMPVSVSLLSGLRKGKLLVSVLPSKELTPVRLDRLQMHDRLSRNEPPYTNLYYRGHWQPLCAYVGLFGCILLVLFSSWVPLYILAARGKLGGYDDLSSNTALIAQLLGAYSGVSLTGYAILHID
jgi:amino acid permease